MAAYDEIPSFSHDKFEAALEQSRLLPMPTKDLLARIQEAVRSKIPFTVGGCQNVIAYLRSLAQEIVDGQMFDTSPAVGPLRTQLTKAGEGGVFAGKFSKWKEGREAVREVKGMLAEIAKPFTKYAVEWENSKRGRLRKFGRRMESDGGFFQGHWDTETGLRSGSGVQIDGDGTYFEGTFLHDKPSGTACVLRFPDGSRLEGAIVEGVAHGVATKYFADGRRYAGSWQHGLQEGQGTMFMPSGTSYRGEWRGGVRCGTGEEVDPSGAVYRGNFAKNAKHGTGKLLLVGGGVVHGTWAAGSLSSIEQIALPSGAVVRGKNLKFDKNADFVLSGANVDVLWPDNGFKAVCSVISDDCPSGSIKYRTSEGCSGVLSSTAVERGLAAIATSTSLPSQRATGWWSNTLLAMIEADAGSQPETSRKSGALHGTHKQPSPVAARHSTKMWDEQDEDIGRYGGHSHYVRRASSSTGK